MGLIINQKYQFIEYLGPNLNLNSLSDSIKSQIDNIQGISNDGNGYLGWDFNLGAGLLPTLETGKSYLVVSKSNSPNYSLYSEPDIATPFFGAIVLDKRFSIIRYQNTTPLSLSSVPLNILQVYGIDSSGTGFLPWSRTSGGLINSLENGKFYLVITNGATVTLWEPLTPTPTPTLTRTPTPTVTLTISPTRTPASTVTPTNTVTPTATPDLCDTPLTTAFNFDDTSVIGRKYNGGYITGFIQDASNPNVGWVLIVAGKDVETSASMVVGATNISTLGTLSSYDGLSNMGVAKALDATLNSYPAFDYCDGLSISNYNGYNDWYLPSVYELELIYRNLKPTTTSNYSVSNNGANDFSSPFGPGYTALNPVQTNCKSWKSGGFNSMQASLYGSSSTESNTQKRISFSDGLFSAGPATAVLIRPVRREIFATNITPTPTPTITATPTVTPTNTPTNTLTPTITLTPTKTLTPTITISPSITATASLTPTPSITPTNTVTPTVSITPTSTVTPTRTPTQTVTPTVSISPTVTATPTVTRTPTVTPTIDACYVSDQSNTRQTIDASMRARNVDAKIYQTFKPSAFGKLSKILVFFSDKNGNMNNVYVTLRIYKGLVNMVFGYGTFASSPVFTQGYLVSSGSPSSPYYFDVNASLAPNEDHTFVLSCDGPSVMSFRYTTTDNYIGGLFIDGWINDTDLGGPGWSLSESNFIDVGKPRPGADGTDLSFITFFDSCAAATSTPTPTLTPTITPTRSPTPTLTVTPTITITPTITPTITNTPGASPSATPTVTPTISLTSSVTPSLTTTPTITPTLTSSITPTATRTPTLTPSITPTINACYVTDQSNLRQVISARDISGNTIILRQSFRPSSSGKLAQLGLLLNNLNSGPTSATLGIDIYKEGGFAPLFSNIYFVDNLSSSLVLRYFDIGVFVVSGELYYLDINTSAGPGFGYTLTSNYEFGELSLPFGGSPSWNTSTVTSILPGQASTDLAFATFFDSCITRTPTPTATVTPTTTPTSSLTPSVTPSITPTKTPTLTPTSTLTPTTTQTPGASPTSTPTVTPTLSLTASLTPTVTPSITPTKTVTPSATISPTVTSTQTPTPSVTPTQPIAVNAANYNSAGGNLSTVGSNGGVSYYGLYDMSGNAGEWSNTNSVSVIRGGGFSSTSDGISKNSRVVTSSSLYDGFRIASSGDPLSLGNFATIGDSNNLSDPDTSYGSVDYSFQVNKFLVTNDDFCAFLNSAAKTDSRALYDTRMGTDSTRGGITRYGTQSSYYYVVKNKFGNKPVIYVSWLDCARYCNWLHNGATDTSDTENGAYTISLGSTSAVARNAGARYWIPSENEWYKAAYYNALTQSYTLYGTNSNDLPSQTVINSDFDGQYQPSNQYDLGLLFMADRTNNRVCVVPNSNQTSVSYVSGFAGKPRSIDFNYAYTLAFVAVEGNQLDILNIQPNNPSDYSIVGSIITDNSPSKTISSSDGSRLFVMCQTAIRVIDSSNPTFPTLSIANFPGIALKDICIDSTASNIYIASSDPSIIKLPVNIDGTLGARQNLFSHGLSGGIDMLKMVLSNNKLYIGSDANSFIRCYDLATNTSKNITLYHFNYSSPVSPGTDFNLVVDGGKVYLSNTIVIYTINTIIDKVSSIQYLSSSVLKSATSPILPYGSVVYVLGDNTDQSLFFIDNSNRQVKQRTRLGGTAGRLNITNTITDIKLKPQTSRPVLTPTPTKTTTPTPTVTSTVTPSVTPTLTPTPTVTVTPTVSLTPAETPAAFDNSILAAAGANNVGQLGDGTYVQKNKFVPINAPEGYSTIYDVRSSALGSHNLIVDSNNRMWGWGNNDKGQVGFNSWTSTPVSASVLNSVNTIIYDSYANKYTLLGFGTDKALMSSDTSLWSSFNLPSVEIWTAGWGWNNNTSTGGAIAVGPTQNSSFAVAANSSTLACYDLTSNAWSKHVLAVAKNWTVMTQSKNRVFLFASNYDRVVVFSPGLSKTMSVGESNLGIGTAAPYWKSAAVNNSGDVIIALASNDNTFIRTLNATASTVSTISWTVGNMPIFANWQEIVHVNGKWFAIASDLNDIYSSTDNGNTWTTVRLPYSASWSNIAYYNNALILVSNSSANVYLSSSDNGITWIKRSLSGSGAPPANIIVNGDFDSLNTPANGQCLSGIGVENNKISTGWTLAGSSQIMSFSYCNAALSLNRYVGLGISTGNGSVAQILNLGSNSNYECSFNMAGQPGYLATASKLREVRVVIRDNLNSIVYDSIFDIDLNTTKPVEGTYGGLNWQNKKFTFSTNSSSQYTVSFSSVSTVTDVGGLVAIDDISMYRYVPVTPTPTPTITPTITKTPVTLTPTPTPTATPTTTPTVTKTPVTPTPTPTPTVTPTRNTTSRTVLLMNFDNANSPWIDSSPTSKNIIPGLSSQVMFDNTNPKFGNGAAKFSGSMGSYLISESSSDFDWSSGDAVIETWIKITNLTWTHYIFYGIQPPGSSGGYTQLTITANNGNEAPGGGLRLEYAGGTTLRSPAGAVTTGVWTHIAVVKSGSNSYIYANGVRVASSNTGAGWSSGACLLRIGSDDSGYISYMDSLRIIRNSDLGYNGNTITVPTSAPN